MHLQNLQSIVKQNITHNSKGEVLINFTFFFINIYMMNIFNLLKKKKIDTPNEYEGVFISEDEIYDKLNHTDTFGLKNKVNEIKSKIIELNNYNEEIKSNK